MKIVSRKVEWFIAAGFIIILISSAAETFLPTFNLDGIKTVADYRQVLKVTNGWNYIVVKQFHNLGTIILAMSLTILGIKYFREGAELVKASLFTIVGIGLCTVMLILFYVTMNFNLNAIKPKPEQMKHNIETSNLDPKVKSKWSQIYARDKYAYEGKVVEYTRESGEKVQYQPTKENVNFRERDLLMKEIWSNNQRLARRGFYFWGAITAVSLILAGR